MPYRQPRIRVSGMIWHDDALLLVRQGHPDRPRWMLPGGGVEAGEALTVALERELGEEISLAACDIIEPVALIESIAPPSSPSGRHLIHVVFRVACDDESVSHIACTDPDVHEVRLCSRTELLNVPIHPPIAAWLSSWQPLDPFAYFGPLWAP